MAPVGFPDSSALSSLKMNLQTQDFFFIVVPNNRLTFLKCIHFHDSKYISHKSVRSANSLNKRSNFSKQWDFWHQQEPFKAHRSSTHLPSPVSAKSVPQSSYKANLQDIWKENFKVHLVLNYKTEEGTCSGLGVWLSGKTHESSGRGPGFYLHGT